MEAVGCGTGKSEGARPVWTVIENGAASRQGGGAALASSFESTLENHRI